MDILTKTEFDKIPAGKIFANGVLPNSPSGLFMTSTGGELRWVAKKGNADDWAIYCHWSERSIDWVAQHGDKVTMEQNIQLCVPCDKNVFDRYRY